MLAKNVVVPVPKVIDELVIFDALSSFITILSPFAIVAVAVISPALVILPCVCEELAAPTSEAV